MEAYFEVYGEPKAKDRPRFGHADGGTFAYTTSKTSAYENLIRMEYKRQCRDAFFEKGVPIRITINAYLTTPMSGSKKKIAQMLEGILLPTKRPDLDNICKSVMDGLNKVAYHDDSQIVKLYIEKYFSLQPRIEVLLEEIKTEEEN